MAIMSPIARSILREHVHKPIVGDIMLIGRQTVPMTLVQAKEMIKSEGVAVREIDETAEWVLDTTHGLRPMASIFRTEGFLHCSRMPEFILWT